MGFISDFKAFAMRGNVIDMAVGIIIGGAFGKIVSSLVSDVIMPPIGMLVGGVDFASIVIPLKHATETDPAVAINIGVFVKNIVDFLIIAISIFMVIRFIARFEKKKAEAATAAPAPTKDQELLSEIRDLLKKQNPQ